MKYSKMDAKAWARENLKGHWTTMVTPFTPEGELDEAGLRRNISYVLTLGTQGLGFNWSYGEYWALTLAERKRIAEIAVEEVAGKALVGIHTTDTCAKNCVELSKHAEQAGADMVIIMQPPSIAKTEEQVHEFFDYVAERVNIGIAIFNQPMVSGMMIRPAGIAKLADITNVVATKEAYPNLMQIVSAQKLAGRKIVVSSPRDDIFFYSMLYGVKQQVVFANALDWMCDSPQTKTRQQYLALVAKNDMPMALEVYQKHIKPASEVFDKWFYFFTSQGIFPAHFCKYWGELIGMAGGPVRTPTMKLTEQQKQDIKKDLQNIGVVK